jgi:F0F1-type ATP synthase membrane subunit b/b'
MHIPPNWGTFFTLIVSFLIFWFIFSRLFFRPFLELLSRRETKLKDLSEHTEQLLAQAKAADEAREKRLSDARHAALERRDTERRAAEADAAEKLDAARSEAHAMLEEARGRIDEELKNAERELGQMGERLAAELAERVLGRPLNGARRSVN